MSGKLEQISGGALGDALENAKRDGTLRTLDISNSSRERHYKQSATVTFKCRVCNCKTYKTQSKRNGKCGPGGYSVTQFYYCEECSTVFMDPKKFSIAKKI